MAEIKLRKVTLEGFIDAIGGILEECRLNFSQEGITVKAVDAANVAMVAAKLPSDMMDPYKSPDIIFGVDLEKFRVALSTMSDDTLSLDVTEKNITIRDGKTEYHCKALDPNSIRKEPKIPKLSPTSAATFSGAEFEEAIKKVGKIGDAIAIETSDAGLFVSTHGDTDDIRRKVVTDQKKIEKAKSLYSLEYLKDISKVVKSAPIVKVDMSTNAPIRFQFSTSGIEVMYLLAPRVDCDEGGDAPEGKEGS